MAYINFHTPEDVVDFAAGFNGHVFVNERGAPFKAAVEFAPYQKAPARPPPAPPLARPLRC